MTRKQLNKYLAFSEEFKNKFLSMFSDGSKVIHIVLDPEVDIEIESESESESESE